MLTEPEKGSPEYWAQENPDRIAVIKDNLSLTYGQWNEQANRVADALEKKGLQPGDRIGMRFRLDFSWFIIQRALQKLGVVQVAVNWKLTADEALYILQDSGAKGLACNDKDVTSWGEKNLDLLITTGQNENTPSLRLEDLINEGEAVDRFGPVRAAMVLYTSGTTGLPKGVPPVDPATVDVERMHRYIGSINNSPPYGDKPVALLSLPVHHGAGPAVATAVCARGGTVVLLDPYDPEEALRLIQNHKVQYWNTVPTMALRIQALPDEVVERYDLTSLKAITTGAAPSPQSLKEWLVKKLGPDVLWEAYGCSECGFVTITAPEHQLAKPGTSGLPIDGVDIAIIDENWKRLDAGETGEIVASTPSVLTHYLGKEQLGEDTVKDGYYRTGDVGHIDEDGFLFITDRIKDMIVAGGVNIYPAEIEKAIVGHPCVEDCTVIGIPHDDFGEQPMAFIVLRANGDVTEADILTFLEQNLASYKRPRKIEFIDQLPLNPMGKVLKNELRAPYWKGRTRNV